MPAPAKREQRKVLCPKCDGELFVGTRAQTVVCRHCNRSIDVQDHAIDEYLARKTFETSGNVIVGKRGTLRADVKSYHVEVRGKVYGSIVARTGVVLHTGSSVEGDVQAPVFQMEEGATYKGHLEVRPKGGVERGAKSEERSV